MPGCHTGARANCLGAAAVGVLGLSLKDRMSHCVVGVSLSCQVKIVTCSFFLFNVDQPSDLGFCQVSSLFTSVPLPEHLSPPLPHHWGALSAVIPVPSAGTPFRWFQAQLC